MAKKGKLQKNERRARLIEKYAETRTELRGVMKDPAATLDEKREAMARLQALPRDSAAVRYRNRCQMTGRPRGFIRKFGISRIALREMSLHGLIPGVRKSSW
ncbi:MAG: 30S ribosomal protein S14 [Gemmatimonadetes bacterium]|nr:30S ribosomal protein S14 [Gemmatimonadota bacterium]MDE2679471.1 30S ribosomal protein S14 [Gemmatimonadota bacterium]MXX34912.1 30S ribosomal protein S14 [Gemmatimonadota bacterium]MYA11852.1 30S ribosomal protein S14 [Gemmatimonadota bacterium]MYD13399.1 30S ribosomal protein S14 [Gemmatimonadota bacterium]